MTDSWDERRRAQEEQYFEKLNQAAMLRLTNRESAEARVCPIDRFKLENSTIEGVIVDRCPKCNGLWLDSGELEQIIQGAQKHASEGKALEYIKNLFKLG